MGLLADFRFRPEPRLFRAVVFFAAAAWAWPTPFHHASAPPSTWARAYGGGGADIARGIAPSPDGGWFFAGSTESPESPGKLVWVAKTNVSGGLEWQKIYGGERGEACAVAETEGGGYAVAGYLHAPGTEGVSAWLMKIDSHGNSEWRKVYGGMSVDKHVALARAVDGGFVLVGSSGGDAWTMKTDASGEAEWRKIFGGEREDYARHVAASPDGGFVLAGYTLSFGAGASDAWVLKLDAAGSVVWRKIYGGELDDYASGIAASDDGGFAVSGWTASFGAKDFDAWVFKLDSEGNVAWQKMFGGAHGIDVAASIVAARDGGFLAVGWSAHFGHSGGDAWALKLDSAGTLEWQRSYGGAKHDVFASVAAAPDGGFAAAGFTESFGAAGTDAFVLRFDVSGGISGTDTLGGEAMAGLTGGAVAGLLPGAGTGYDAWWAFGRGEDGSVAWRSMPVSAGKKPAPITTSDGGFIRAGHQAEILPGASVFYVEKFGANGKRMWRETFGGAHGGYAYSAQESERRGVIVAGYDWSAAGRKAAFRVSALDGAGALSWRRETWGDSDDYAYGVARTPDGGLAVAGYSGTFDALNDFWAVRVDSSGRAEDRDLSVQDTAAKKKTTAAIVADFPTEFTEMGAAALDSPSASAVSLVEAKILRPWRWVPLIPPAAATSPQGAAR